MSRACGTKCSYVNCGKSARSELGLKLYRFPKDVSSSRQWILNCGKNIFPLIISNYNFKICLNNRKTRLGMVDFYGINFVLLF